MNIKKVSEVFFPTNVIIIDEDVQFGTILSEILPNEFNTYKCFSSPVAAVKYINERMNEEQAHFCLVDEQLDLRTLLDDERCKPISTLIVDYNMPGMNGIELLKQVKGNFQRILLTGVMDEAIAIQAFNGGLIDKYLTKYDSEMLEKLSKSIKEYNHAYFKSQIFDDYSTEVLRDKDFINIFSKVVRENNIVGYYLYDSNGSFLMKNKEGQTSLFYILTDHDFEEMAEVVSDAGYYDLAQQIKERKLMIYPKTSNNNSENNWNDCVYKVHKAGIQNICYYAMISNICVKDKLVDFGIPCSV